MPKYSEILPLFKNEPIPHIPFGHVCVYKIVCSITGEYYIGQTEDIKRRAYRHFTCIYKTIEGKECMAFPFHKKVSSVLKMWTLVSIKSAAKESILKHISIKVMAVLPNKKDADKFEYGAIPKSDPLCLNRRYS